MDKCRTCTRFKEHTGLQTYQSYLSYEGLLYKILYHAAPTLQGIKPASLIRLTNTKQGNMKDLWFEYKDEIMGSLNVEYKELNRSQDYVCVLFYHPGWMEKLLGQKKTKSYLRAIGYAFDDAYQALDSLESRFVNGCPNEIGIFLGYPLSDVMAFSGEKKDQSLINGYWRVYSKVNEALKTFRLYDLARLMVVERLNEGHLPSAVIASI